MLLKPIKKLVKSGLPFVIIAQFSLPPPSTLPHRIRFFHSLELRAAKPPSSDTPDAHLATIMHPTATITSLVVLFGVQFVSSTPLLASLLEERSPRACRVTTRSGQCDQPVTLDGQKTIIAYTCRVAGELCGNGQAESGFKPEDCAVQEQGFNCIARWSCCTK